LLIETLIMAQKFSNFIFACDNQLLVQSQPQLFFCYFYICFVFFFHFCIFYDFQDFFNTHKLNNNKENKEMININ